MEPMRTEIEEALAPLVGLALTGAGRSGGMLQVQFGDGQRGPARRNGIGGRGRSGGSGEGDGYAMHVSCTWRLESADGILTGSGDYFTPADPDADPDGFDWDATGANWCDVRLKAFVDAIGSEPPVVRSVVVDRTGGVQLRLDGDVTLVLFPDSSHTEHVETEFWRLLEPGDDLLHFVVSSEGADRVTEGGDE